MAVPLHFPPEILTAIIHEATIDDALAGNITERRQTLKTFSLVSHAWNACATEVNYSHLVIKWTSESHEGITGIFERMPHLRSKVQSLTVEFCPTSTYEDEIREAVSERAYYAWWSLPEDPTDYQGKFDTSYEDNAGDSIEYHPSYPGWTRKVNSKGYTNEENFTKEFEDDFRADLWIDWIDDEEEVGLNAFFDFLPELENLKSLYLHEELEHSTLSLKLKELEPLLRGLRRVVVHDPDPDPECSSSAWMEEWEPYIKEETTMMLDDLAHLAIAPDPASDAPIPPPIPLSFPPEILVKIISEATLPKALAGKTKRRTRALKTFALVSRAWRDCATEVKYSHLVLEWTFGVSENILKIFKDRPELAAKVQSLTVTFNPVIYRTKKFEVAVTNLAWAEWRDLPPDDLYGCPCCRRDSPDYPGWMQEVYFAGLSSRPDDNMEEFRAEFNDRFEKAIVCRSRIRTRDAFLELLVLLRNLKSLYLFGELVPGSERYEYYMLFRELYWQNPSLSVKLEALSPRLLELRTVVVNEPSGELRAQMEGCYNCAAANINGTQAADAESSMTAYNQECSSLATTSVSVLAATASHIDFHAHTVRFATGEQRALRNRGCNVRAHFLNQQQLFRRVEYS
ncbi:hypothetical protein RQP46_002434 [Phenoliferia psychrophenolica]